LRLLRMERSTCVELYCQHILYRRATGSIVGCMQLLNDHVNKKDVDKRLIRKAGLYFMQNA